MKKRILLLAVALCLVAPVQYLAAAIGAAVYSNTTGATNAPVVAKVGACLLCGYNFSNTNAGTVYVQFFDAATTAGITLGTTAPKFSIAVPAGGGVTDGLYTFGPGFTNGVVVACTTTAAGSTAPGVPVPVTLFFN